MIESLVQRARAGDSKALEQLLAEVAPRIERFGQRMCKNSSDADDVLQDTLLAIATHLGEFEGRSSLLSWVFTLTRSACVRRKRGLKNQVHEGEPKLLAVSDPGPNPEERAAEGELASALQSALDALSDQHREVIMLRDVEGLAAPEVAAALGLSVEAVKSRLHRARAALRALLQPRLEQGAPPRSTSCPEVVAMWSSKLEGDLSPVDCSAMEAHITTCAACGAACNALKSALFACQQSATTELRPEVQARVKAAVRAWSAGLQS